MKFTSLLICLSATLAPAAWAQSLCASDGQPTPTTLVERFISADCEACWGAPQTPEPAGASLVLDWIVPSAQEDAAPLSAGASRDALMRLETLGRSAPAPAFNTRTPVARNPDASLRVAHGVAVGGYIGASIELNTSGKPWQEPLFAWLVLVETIAANTEGTVSERNLVRNVLLTNWTAPQLPSTGAPLSYREARPLNIAPSATPARLRVVGWVQDASGRVLSAAQSVCAAPDADPAQ